MEQEILTLVIEVRRYDKRYRELRAQNVHEQHLSQSIKRELHDIQCHYHRIHNEILRLSTLLPNALSTTELERISLSLRYADRQFLEYYRKK